MIPPLHSLVKYDQPVLVSALQLVTMCRGS